jgi:hypothetical protein
MARRLTPYFFKGQGLKDSKQFQIVVAKLDKECPVCDKSRKDGFDIGFDENGEIDGARCGREHGGCGWSF